MSDDGAKKLSGAEEYIAAEIELSEPLDPDQEKSLRDALEKVDPQAFDSCDIGIKKISLCYDPTRTSKEHLLQIVKQSGAKLEHVESEGSPLL
jgi:DNA polymerase sigma